MLGNVLVAPGQQRKGEATRCRRFPDVRREPVKVVLNLTGVTEICRPAAVRADMRPRMRRV